jgi:hypothetical protein
LSPNGNIHAQKGFQSDGYKKRCQDHLQNEQARGAGFFLFTIFDLFEGSYIILTSPLSEGQTDWRKA